MCGIYGSTVYYTDDIIQQKLSRVNFRGPDYSAFERLGKLVLGHNRLSIIDLDPRANQPFTYQNLKIVFNGEIYNYQHLKANLKSFGYKFYTDSDTEVLAAAYLKYGADCVNHFNGMFAFVIYDTERQELFGARDRLGKKPFYYAHQELEFEFASQPSQIILNRDVNLDLQAVNEYFIWGYVPDPRSAWQEIKKLEAGFCFRFHLPSGKFEKHQYWNLLNDDLHIYAQGYKQAKFELEELLSDAVKIRMHADVSIGVFLSGGIDSSLVAALAAANTNRVNTFCIKFQEKGFDESGYAQKIADHLKTNHHVIECYASEGLSLIEDFGKYYDEPFSDSSAIPGLLLNKYTKKYVTVALSGDGGDESFMGYSRYRWMHQANRLLKFPLMLRKRLARLIELSPNYRHKLIAMGIASSDIKLLYANMLGGLDYTWLQHPEAGLQVPFMDILSQEEGSFLYKLSAFDIKTYLNGDINTKVDRASMAYAVETRAPLMDHRIVTFALQLPDEYKYAGGNQKRILKDILYQYVPAKLFDRPKSGFTTPLRDWFRNELKEYVLDELSPHELKDIPAINVQKASHMIDEHMTGKWNRSAQIWKLLVFKQWLNNQKTCVKPLLSEV